MLNNGYNKRLIGQLIEEFVRVNAFIFVIKHEHCVTWNFKNDQTRELNLHACTQTGTPVVACLNSPSGMCSATFALVCVHPFIIKYQGLIFSLTAATFLTREEDVRGNCSNKFGNVWVTLCDAFPAKTPTMPRTPWQPLHLWLMTSPIVGPRACDLLIKFVFTSTERVGLTTVTHGTDVVPSQTAQSKTPGVLCSFGTNIIIHLYIQFFLEAYFITHLFICTLHLWNLVL